MIKQLAHICINASDLDAVDEFYCGVLGLNKKFLFRRGDEVVGFYIDFGNGTFVEFFKNPKAGGGNRIAHFCLEVDDIDAMVSRLKRNGVECTDKKLGADGSWQIWVEDPNGVKIEFHQYTEKSSQLTGTDCKLGA